MHEFETTIELLGDFYSLIVEFIDDDGIEIKRAMVKNEIERFYASDGNPCPRTEYVYVDVTRLLNQGQINQLINEIVEAANVNASV